MPIAEQVDRELTHTLRVDPLDTRFAAPIAALAVIGSGAWLFARDRHLGVT